MVKPAAFIGLIREVKQVIDPSEDKACRLVIKFNTLNQEDAVDALNHLFAPGRGVYVVIFDEGDDLTDFKEKLAAVDETI
jgi:hypothetical protein